MQMLNSRDSIWLKGQRNKSLYMFNVEAFPQSILDPLLAEPTDAEPQIPRVNAQGRAGCQGRTVGQADLYEGMSVAFNNHLSGQAEPDPRW